MFKIGNHLVCHFDRREKSLNTVSCEQRSEGFLIPLRSIRNDITDLGCQNPLGVVAGICFGIGLLYLFIGLRHQDERPLNLTLSPPLMLILELEQNALLLYSR
jgi:hypothetical protein